MIRAFSDVSYVHKPSDIPSVEHLAILKFSHRSTSTYEANDGELTLISYEVYKSKDAWLAEIQHLESINYKNYRAICVKPAKVATSVKVDVE